MQYESFCAAVYVKGETDEYCLRTRGRERRIVAAVPGGRDSWVIMGHAYWTKAFAEGFMRFLEEEYDRPETASKLWDDVFIDHADELKMVMRPYPAQAIHEFDSLDQLQDFDPEFIEQRGDRACRTTSARRWAAVRRGDILDVQPLKQGMTNLSFYFACRGQGYVYRHPGAGTDEIVDSAGGGVRAQGRVRTGARRHVRARGPESRLEGVALRARLHRVRLPRPGTGRTGPSHGAAPA